MHMIDTKDRKGATSGNISVGSVTTTAIAGHYANINVERTFGYGAINVTSAVAMTTATDSDTATGSDIDSIITAILASQACLSGLARHTFWDHRFSSGALAHIKKCGPETPARSACCQPRWFSSPCVLPRRSRRLYLHADLLCT